MHKRLGPTEGELACIDAKKLLFTTDGGLPIDNNDTERDLRRLTIGRGNWLFIGSAAAGDVAATMYTLIASASRHNVDLWAYLDDVLRRLAGGQTELESLLPDRWAAAHPKSIRTYRQDEQEARQAKTAAPAAASSPPANASPVERLPFTDEGFCSTLAARLR